MQSLKKVKRPNAEIFDVVRKICPKEDIGEAIEGQQSCGSDMTKRGRA